jgi:hypothetical protein
MYVLGRKNDTGNYTKDNCRFILQSTNAKEKYETKPVKKKKILAEQFFDTIKTLNLS